MANNAEQFQTPLEYYEKAIAELTDTREQLQTELETLREMQSYYETLKTELATTKAEFQEKIEATNTELKTLRKKQSSYEMLKQELIITKTEFQEKIEATNTELKKQQEKLYRIESGAFWGSEKRTKGWKGTLNDAKGDNRFIRQYIKFDRAFKKSPKVVVGISYANVSREATHRLKVQAVDIENTGFFLEIHTWGHTEVFGCEINWLAYGH